MFRLSSVRVVEAYVGEYASGKSENAVNRSLNLLQEGRKVRLVDLDIVEPFYTLRPLKKFLEQVGINVLGWETVETIGLGEAGIPLKAEMTTAFNFKGDVIIDLGYGVNGRNILNLITGSFQERREKIHLNLVINITRPLTSSFSLLVSYITEFGEVDGLINNTHLGEETTIELIQEGAMLVTQVARELGIRVVATTVLRPYAEEIGEFDLMGNKVWPLDRYMPYAMW